MKNIGDVNLFRYVGNNPLNFNDPEGELANFVIGFAVGIVLDVAVQVVVDGGFDDFSLTQSLISGGAGAAGVGLANKIGTFGKYLPKADETLLNAAGGGAINAGA